MAKHIFVSSKCLVDECTFVSTPDKRLAFDMCLKHYRRWRRNGSPYDEWLQIAAKGAEVVTYITTHQRLGKEKGSASQFECVACYKQAEEWAYDHDDPDVLIGHVRGKPTPYSLNFDHYIPLCRTCHKEWDSGR